MVSSPPDPLTPLQRDLLTAFFAVEQRFFLTGGAALAGFYLHHRVTDDLELFTSPGVELGQAAYALEAAVAACGATSEPVNTYPDFRRVLVRRAEERCVVDLVIDRAPAIESQKVSFGAIRVDTLREITANKICAVLGRSQVKDLVDLRLLLERGADLEQALADAQRKDRSVDPATLAWLLEQMSISEDARLPGGVDPRELEVFRRTLRERLELMAFERARKE